MLSLIETGDGSYSLFDEKLNETYHSVHGAATESMHVFIKNGLEYVYGNRRTISVLEVGLGTALNALLSYEWGVHQPEAKIIYRAIEPYPVEQQLMGTFLERQTPKRKEILNTLHQAPYGETLQIGGNFHFIKECVSLEDFTLSEQLDLIYYDAFAPQVQPEMWTLEAMQKCASLLNKSGVWVSYCAKGQVRRNLLNCGMKVERLPGPPGKREMLRALR